MKLLQELYKEKIIPFFKDHKLAKNVLEVPRITKVVVNIGTGRLKDEKERVEAKSIVEKVTGQRPEDRPARIAIASFKSRKGMVIGYRVTLRGKRMWDFLNRLVYAAIPRTRDFRGLKESGIDSGGNFNIGMREHIVFPEMIGEDVRRIYSMQVTIVTTAGTQDRAEKLFKTLGFPLAKAE